MIPNSFSYLLLSLIIFFVVWHLSFDIRSYRNKKYDRVDLLDYDIEIPIWLTSSIVVFSLLLVFFWVSIPILSIFSISSQLDRLYLQFRSPYRQVARITGIILISEGVFLACWARSKRGNYSPSWGLSEEIPLITGGPYRFIRHPNYNFYVVSFIGLPLVTQFWPSYVLIGGIYVYTKLVNIEEILLKAHFGNLYEEYIVNTGKFIPKII